VTFQLVATCCEVQRTLSDTSDKRLFLSVCFNWLQICNISKLSLLSVVATVACIDASSTSSRSSVSEQNQKRQHADMPVEACLHEFSVHSVTALLPFESVLAQPTVLVAGGSRAHHMHVAAELQLPLLLLNIYARVQTTAQCFRSSLIRQTML
jgi:hypothetical protein